MKPSLVDYFRALYLLLEKCGYHPRIDHDEEWAEMLRRAGWRPFHCEWITR